MNVSQKSQYALRALLELSKRRGDGPVSSSQIASNQAIPGRFLELILGQLRRGGFVESRRGVHGGYMLAMVPGDITVGKVIEFIDGPISPVDCIKNPRKYNCRFNEGCAFMSLWRRAAEALREVYGATTFQDLLDEDTAGGGYVPGYSI